MNGPDDDLDDSDDDTDLHTPGRACIACDGLGRDRSNKPCTPCGGTGRQEFAEVHGGEAGGA